MSDDDMKPALDLDAERRAVEEVMREQPNADEKSLVAAVMRRLKGRGNPAVVLRCIRARSKGKRRERG